jgi:hypothetical protein
MLLCTLQIYGVNKVIFWLSWHNLFIGKQIILFTCFGFYTKAIIRINHNKSILRKTIITHHFTSIVLASSHILQQFIFVCVVTAEGKLLLIPEMSWDAILVVWPREAVFQYVLV